MASWFPAVAEKPPAGNDDVTIGDESKAGMHETHVIYALLWIRAPVAFLPDGGAVGYRADSQGARAVADFYAHSGRKSDYSGWQLLRDHLRGVAELAKRFAAEARPGDEGFAQAAYVAGLLHDLGKYRGEFQEYIRGQRVKGESTRHKQIGAARAYQLRRLDLMFAILGHHAGMPDNAKMAEDVRAAADTVAKVMPAALADCPEVGVALDGWGKGILALTAEMQTRLLFSCLVDADWLDTSRHEARCNGWDEAVEARALEAAALLGCVLRYIETRAVACRDERIRAIRRQVLQAALGAAKEQPGLFSMAVPTGGGKTLSSLAFALEHARLHGLRRVIYVAPYLSIIEQNARVFRDALGERADVVFEHHSMAEPTVMEDGRDDAETAQGARLAENWDAPVVLTTSVQFYETLFSNQPSRCRKLHNIGQSVVILDECQTLPPGLLAPTCQMLQQATDYLGCTLVLCTATQPAWKKDVTLLPEGLENVRAIVPESLGLAEQLKRVNVNWKGADDAATEWASVAQRMRQQPQALCIVNTKKAARALFEVLRQTGGDAFHLSTSMCPVHRLKVLDEVRERLAAGRACYLVSTQLIEAGVDVDFPLLLRELAPLDAIVQAAGRCNREGLLGCGEVVVFRSADGSLPGDAWYRNGTAVVRQDFLACGREPDIHRPDCLGEYYWRLYRTGELDEKEISAARRSLSFSEVAGKYRLIDEVTTPLVVTGCVAWRDEIEALLSELRDKPSRDVYRKLQRYSVNVYEHDLRQLGGSVVLDYLPGVNLCGLPYDESLGLVPAGAGVALTF